MASPDSKEPSQAGKLIFWHSPKLGSVLYSLYKIPLAQACFPLASFPACIQKPPTPDTMLPQQTQCQSCSTFTCQLHWYHLDLYFITNQLYMFKWLDIQTIWNWSSANCTLIYFRALLLSLKTMQLDVIMIISLCNLTGTSAALLLMCLSNFRVIGKV